MSKTIIPYREAIARVGQAIYGDNWIGSLSSRQEWLLEEYADEKSYGLFTIIIYNTKRSKLTPSLLDEFTKAEDRGNWMHAQYDEARYWLSDRGMTHAAPINRIAFTAAFSKAFGRKVETKSPLEIEAPAPKRRAARKRGRKPVLSNQIKAQMKSDINDGILTTDQLDGMIEKEMGQRYGASREIVRNARNEVLSEFGRNRISDK